LSWCPVCVIYVFDDIFSEGDFTSLPPEPQQGNIEYKLKLVNPSSHRLEHLVSMPYIFIFFINDEEAK
jgi:hypothetical protein